MPEQDWTPEERANLKDLLENYGSMKRAIAFLKALGKFLGWLVAVSTPIVSLWLAIKHGGPAK